MKWYLMLNILTNYSNLINYSYCGKYQSMNIKERTVLEILTYLINILDKKGRTSIFCGNTRQSIIDIDILTNQIEVKTSK